VKVEVEQDRKNLRMYAHSSLNYLLRASTIYMTPLV